MRNSKVLAISLIAALGWGCGDDDTPAPVDGGTTMTDGGTMVTDGGTMETDGGMVETDGGMTMACAETYGAGYEDSVSYSGQSFRHALISSLNTWIIRLGDTIDMDAMSTYETPAAVEASLDFYFEFNSDENGGEDILVTTDPARLQTTWEDLSSNKNLLGKTAGNDTSTDHRDWSMEFTGWDDTSALGDATVDSPTALIRAFFTTLAENGAARARGEQPTADEALHTGELPVFVTADGMDLRQLINKVLLMSVTFSQGTDDYLDDDVADKGLRASNVVEDGDSYSPLAHAWDEGFGYFGAARDYACYTDDELAKKGGRDDWQGLHDTDGDGAIDLRSEINFGAAVNAGKRDRGATEATDFTNDAITAFRAGRDLIASVDGELSEAQRTELAGYRDAAVTAWENAIAATVVHYINDTIADMDAFTDADEEYSFLDHTKHWGEMKGFAIGLQFNPRSPLHGAHDGGTYFDAIHTLMGGRPVLPNDDAAADYRAALVQARGLMADAYGFSAANVENW